MALNNQKASVAQAEREIKVCNVSDEIGNDDGQTFKGKDFRILKEKVV